MTQTSIDGHSADPKKVNYLIIGGGLSGITFANYIQGDYLVLEKESSLGGYCKTIPNKQFVWDYAGHFYHFRTQEFKNLFLSLVDESEIIKQKKVTRIYYKDKLINYPFQSNIHELDKQEFIDCLCDLYFRDTNQDYRNFLSMLYGKFGKAIVEKFLKPYNEKLYATDLSELDVEAMGRFFPHANFESIMDNIRTKSATSYNDEFLYLKKGAGYFIDKLAEQIDSKKVCLNCEVKKIDAANKFVTLKNGTKIYYDHLISTIPMNALLNRLGESSLSQNLSYNKVLVFNLGFDGPSKRYQKEHWVYFPDKSFNFYRVGFYNNILASDKLSIYVEIGFSKDAPIDERAELQKTIAGLKATGVIDSSITLVDSTSVIMDPAYVHISSKTNAELRDIESRLKIANISVLGRYGKWTYSSMEDCMVWAKELANSLNKG